MTSPRTSTISDREALRLEELAREADRRSRLATWLGIICLAGFIISLAIEFHDVRHEAALRARNSVYNCLRVSKTLVSDINRDWINFQTDRVLVANVQGPRRTALTFREDSDYMAAKGQALSIDRQDATLVNVRTAFGYNPTPRNWVYSANYSCRRQFR